MRRRLFALMALSSLALTTGGAVAETPVYEARVLPEVGKVLPAQPCARESVFDMAHDYDDQCTRLKVVFGPIWMKPGQNDVLIQPVTFEKPMYPGYLVRFKPDLVTVDGTAPRVKDAHLHHGTWLNTGYLRDVGGQLPVNPTRTYGWGPWIASGEEKTTVVWPEGFGLKIQPSDSWLFLHMIHNALPTTYPVWVTYDLDFVAAEYAEEIVGGAPRIRGTKGIWLDVGDCNHWTADGCQKDSWNPVFNIHRGMGGGVPGEEGACVFPRENCGMFNTLARQSTQQGIDKGPVFDEWTIPVDGTLVMMGGHLHNGGLRDDVYLVRDGVERLIHVSDAYYFDHDWDPNAWKPEDDWDPQKSKIGGPPVSWDFVMTGVTGDTGWKINVKKGDKLRLEGVYDSSIASWYEQMGIVMSWIVPDEYLGVDPFDPRVTVHKGVNAGVVQPGTVDGYDIPGTEVGSPCVTDLDPSDGSATVCARGQMTHARIPSSADHNICGNGCPDVARSAPDGPVVDQVHMGGFTYGVADFGVIGATGVPRVVKGKPVTFYNEDTADYMWHTVTRCANPCSGSTESSYPIADGSYDHLIDPETGLTPDGETVSDLLQTRGADPMDFDSGQIGYGTGANNKLSWTFTPTETGTFTFFCRIHPGMRGAIRVVDAA